MVTWFENGSLPKMYRLKTMMWRMSVVLADKIFFVSAGGGGGYVNRPPHGLSQNGLTINLRSGDFFFRRIKTDRWQPAIDTAASHPRSISNVQYMAGVLIL